jgi:allantoinase
LSTPAFALTGARPAAGRTRDLGLESPFEFGARIGAARVLRRFDDYDAKATIYACGRALERNLDIARPVLDTVARAGAGSPWLELALRAP